MNLSLIVAMSDNRVIGRDGDLPWRMSSDLRRFRSLTMGHYVILGRKTYDSIGRPLPGRTFVVLTRDESFQSDFAQVAHDIDEAVGIVQEDDQPFVIGGAEIYRLFLPRVDSIYLTSVHTTIADGDAFFPDLDLKQWNVADSKSLDASDRDEFASTFEILTRRSS